MPPSVTGPLIQIRDLSHQFDGRLLFDNISLSVSP